HFQVYDQKIMGRIAVELQGRVNDCRALTYRQDIKAKDIEKYTTLKLPTRQMMTFYSLILTLSFNNFICSGGYVVISTPDGILDHEEAISRNAGGQAFGYFH
ncbi:hypothetical protein SCA6_010006, partial [Theobroma cacao]